MNESEKLIQQYVQTREKSLQTSASYLGRNIDDVLKELVTLVTEHRQDQ